MPLLLFVTSLFAVVGGAVAAVAARVQGGCRGVVAYAAGPLAVLAVTGAFAGSNAGAVLGLAAVAFATGLYAGGFTVRPLLVKLRLATPEVRYTLWS
jgi:hypothetical protein